MNRLVIIGNGFDLAHGLPTSYKDFIDDYWKNITDESHNDEFISFEDIHFKFKLVGVENLEGLANFIMQYDEKIKFSDAEIYREYGNNFLNGRYPRRHILNYKNGFFRLINQKAIQNWVDIENEYYRELKMIVKLTSTSIDDKKEKVIILNNEFEQIKNLFEKYLLEKVFKVFNFNEYNDFSGNMLKFPHLFKPVSYRENSEGIQCFLDEFPKPNQEEIKNQFVNRGNDLISNCKITFLNFNYTPTLFNYNDILNRWHVESEIIYIHGQLNDNINKINFGFGDEMDGDYKSIENLDDNEYLKNFKSFQYLHTSNYKQLLDLIDSDIFQIYIMGHSCGLSDRVMLNTIFEHPNCISIKVFYHQKEDGTDNYTEIIQNISRHFNKKKLMREKIVNKTLCEPLPQIQLPLK